MISIYKHTIIILLILTAFKVNAQEDNDWDATPELNISGFADIYYFYDMNQPTGDSRQPFLFNHNRHNEFNLNLGLISLNLNHQKYRANISLQSGTYANDNYIAEQGVFKNIFEANVGMSLNKANDLWIDAGIFPSHLGFESAISTDNLTLTRSLLAESSPYFLSGTKLTYNPSDKIEVAAIASNGWQRIQRVAGNSIPSFGTQFIIKPSSNVSVNWSTFITTEDPDTNRRMRYFNDLYGQFNIGEKVKLITGFDFGIQQTTKGSNSYDYWMTPVIIGQYSLCEKWKTAIRFEYFQDENGVIIPTGTSNGFQTTGLSLNLDYSPTQNVAWRIEGRLFGSKDEIFVDGTNLSNNNFFVGTSLAIKLPSTQLN